MKKGFTLKSIINTYTAAGFGFLTVALIFILIPTAPYVWYRINPEASEKDVEKIAKEVIIEIDDLSKDAENRIPELDTNLPQGYHVVVDSVGINSPISDSKDYRKALLDGSWIVPNYGTPEQDYLPIIVAAHRFGYSNWSREFRNRVSFFNLPNTDIGDTVDIYWNQRKYTYKIYAKEDSTYISDYSADLILYTCKYFNSPVRIFRYAERVN